MSSRYAVCVSKEYLKFSAAHFIAYRGFREALHGHNYQVSVRVEGSVGPDGYVLDFGVLKRAASRVCESLDEKVLLPSESECLTFSRSAREVTVTHEDGARFSFPETDVVLLPIAHSSAEELARYMLARVLSELPDLEHRGVHWIEVGVAEAPGQVAYCRQELGISRP